LIEIGTLSLSALAVALIVVLLNHLLANSRDKAKERRTAGNAVFEAFRPELDALNQTDNDCMLILTESAYHRHETAVRNFLPFLSWIDRFVFIELGVSLHIIYRIEKLLFLFMSNMQIVVQ